jgi:uncharacterized cupin superfamily protein
VGYILQGEPTLVTDAEEIRLCPGMCAGFARRGIAHQLVNRTDKDVVYEIGDHQRRRRNLSNDDIGRR